MQKKHIVDISNKGMDSTKLLKDQVFLKVCRTYHATLESWIRNHQLIGSKPSENMELWLTTEKP
jgi:hypothetical protein